MEDPSFPHTDFVTGPVAGSEFGFGLCMIVAAVPACSRRSSVAQLCAEGSQSWQSLGSAVGAEAGLDGWLAIEGA